MGRGRGCIFLLSWLTICLPTARAAGEPAAISLFDRQSLSGWNYGAKPPRGWKVEDGVLSCDHTAPAILSGWSWADAEIRFRWRVSDGGQWELRLIDATSGEAAATLLLSQGDAPSFGLSFADRVTEIVVAPTRDNWHEAVFRRKGSELKITPDVEAGGESSVRLAGDHRFVLEFGLVKGTGALADLTAKEPAGEAIFNGRDLAGWWTPGNPASWLPEDGRLVLVNKKGNYLRTEREYGNFTLSLEYKMAKGGNSGIGIRTARNGWPSGDGMELQLLDERIGTPLTRHSTMAIYGNLEPLARADRSQEWNRVVIKAEGYMISAWVNGALVQHVNTAALPELRRRNLKGWIGLQDHGARTEFRDLRVLEAPDGLGLKAWQTPPPPSGSQLVLERLMNSERLAIDDGVGSGAVDATVKGKGEQTLAELSGPGAVVIVSRTSLSGQLAFYFNGESTPRLECRADKLHEHLPLVGENKQPLLTYLPYSKSLKLTIKDAKPADYRLDYVTFPANVPLEDFVEGASCVARGLLPALSYRHQQLGWGTHREADPLPRAGSDGQKIDEQSQAALVDLKGPGIVEWTKLIAAPSLLADDELWLEVSVDEEPTPAVSAPARYFFPGLAGGNYPNYVVLNRNGWTNMLAMPFRSRLTIALANHGRRPVNPVGIAVSYQPLTDSNDPRLARRLRGTFETEGNPPDRAWVKQSGSGRLIGLVTQCGRATAGVDALAIDGESRVGWHSPDWRAFLGIDAQAANERRSLSGRQGDLQWRFFLLAPPEFRESLALRASDGPRLGNRLALFYMDAE